MTTQPRVVEPAAATTKAADSKKGEDVVALDVSSPMMITDAFVLASADSERLAAVVVDETEDDLCDFDAKPARREGVRGGRWALLDYGNIVVRVFRSEEYDLYGLDRLWRDCPRIEIKDIEQPDNEDGEDFARNTRSIDETPLATESPDTSGF